MRKRVALLVVLFIGASQAFAETAIGTVSESEGTAAIDSFGKGAFIAVIPGDVLYPSSVVKTGPGGRVVIDLKGTRREIPPGATVEVADLLAAGERRGALSWFSALGKILKSFSATTGKQETEKTLGSKAANAGEEEQPLWELGETDPEALLPKALESIAAGRYGDALATLGRAEQPADQWLRWDLLFWKGFSYYQMEDYGDAAACLSSARDLEKTSAITLGTPSSRATLLFQLGSSYFLLGQEKQSVPVLDMYLAGNPGGQYAPYATILLARALAATGDAARARSVAADGAARYRGTDFEKELSSLAR